MTTAASHRAASPLAAANALPVDASPASPGALRVEGARKADAARDRLAVERTLAGERKAFEEIVARYEAPLFRHLRRLAGSVEMAEDLVQETFLKAWRGLGSWRQEPGASFSSWLYRIATNEAMSALRKKSPNVVDLEDAEPFLEDPRTPSPRRVAAGKELVERLLRAVEKLPPLVASIFLLRYREEMAVEEIAAVVGKKPNAVSVALHRARLALRPHLFDSADAAGEE